MADLQPAIRQGEADAAAAQPIAVAAHAANPRGAPRPIANQAPIADQAQIIAGLPAAVPGGNMPAFQAPARHNTFASLFADNAADANHADAFQIVNNFDSSAAAPLTAAALKQAILGQQSAFAFLCCATLHGNVPKIYVLHSLSRFPVSLAGRPTPWDNRIVGFLGDIVGDAVLNVLVPETIFDETPETSVYNMETLTNDLPALAEDALFPRVRANAANAVTRQSRYLTYLPTRFASMILDNKGYSAKRIWTILVQRFQDDDCLDQMAPLIQWLRLSLHATGQNDTGPPVTNLDIVSPFLDQDLANHRLPFRQVLTGLQPQAPGLETAIAQFATAVNSQVAEAQTARLIREIERDQPTTPAVKFDMLFDSLLNYLNVATEQELPEFWFRFAAAKKKQEFATVRDALETYSRSARSFGPFAPIPSPKLLADLASITFVGDHADDTKTGLQPFMAMDGSEEFRAAAQELARTYNMLYERDVGITYSDLENFKLPKDIRGHPTTFFELEKSLMIFGNLVGTILGNNHPITMAFRTFWTAFNSEYKARLHHEIDSRKFIKPVHILRSLQLSIFNWFNAKKMRRTPTPPPFMDILERLSVYSYTTPVLPPPLYQLINPKPPTRPPPTFPGTIPPPIVSDDASMQSGMSSITGATGLTRLTSHPRYGQSVTNPALDPALAALLPATVRVKDLLGNDDAPKNEQNNPMCLSFHLRGVCFAGCRRKTDHDRPLTNTDKNLLSNWVIDQLAKRRASGAIPP